MRRLLALLLILSPLSSLLSPAVARATEYQQCQTSATCTIGEFLYDDSYSPLPSQTCTLNAKDPSGTAFITNQAMTSRSDGWYSYDASIGTTEGLYTATICCTPATGTMCLDKSFEVKAASGSSLTPAAIWGYSDRTLTSYGSLVSDIWNYSSRSLTSFGSLVSDIWGHSSRTMTSFGSLVENIWGATPSTLTASDSPTTLNGIISEQKTQRELLEKLVNAPVVTLSLEDNDQADLSLKLETSKKQASLLYDSLQSTKSRLMTLDSKWDRLSESAITAEITSISSSWTDSSPLQELTKSWNTQVVKDLNEDAVDLKSTLVSLLASVSSNKSSVAPSNLIAALELVDSLEQSLGDVTSGSSNSTLFGYLTSVSERQALLESEHKKLSAVLEDWESTGESNLSKQISSSQAKIMAINEYPGGESVLEPSNKQASGKLALKNLVFSLQGLIGLNQNLLASSANSPVRGLWLEEGSIIFRAVITNPSTIISQTAPLKFYLPKEIQDGDIMTIDPDLSASYDTNNETLAVTGSFELKPGATKIVAVEVEDVWQLKEDELIALKTKSSELLKTLSKSNLHSQGIVLDSGITVAIDKLLHSQNKNVQPQNRIRAYREAQLELLTAKSNMTELENLVAQAGSNQSLTGFVGGVGTTAVFGIVLVVVAGFVFLSLYFKKMGLSPSPSSDLSAVRNEVEDRSELLQPEPARLSPLSLESKAVPSWQMPAIIAAVMIVTAGGTLLLTRAAKPKPEPSEPVMINQVVQPSPTSTPTPTEPPTPSPSSDPEKTKLLQLTHSLVVPEDSSVNIRNKPSSNADIIMAIKETQDVYVFEEDGDWRQIGFKESDSTKGYWVNVKFIEEK